MALLISKTYERWTQDDIETGDTDDKGYEFESVEHTFGELVDLMRYHREASQYPNDGNRDVWLTNDNANEGTNEFFLEGITERTSIHFDDANSFHNARYWRLAMKFAGILTK